MVTRGFAGSLLVLIGGVVISTLPESTALMQIALVTELRGAEAGRMVGLAVVLLGLGLHAAAWLQLCRHVARVEGADRDDALALVRHATIVWSAPLVLAPPLFSRDGWSYAAQGVLAHFEHLALRIGAGGARRPDRAGSRSPVDGDACAVRPGAAALRRRRRRARPATRGCW